MIGQSRIRKHGPKSRNDSRRSTDERTKTVITQCLVCRRSISSPLETYPKRAPKSELSVSRTTATHPHGTGSTINEPQAGLPANSASKKRARARKQSGLQAMLLKSKNAEKGAPAPALNLMDFMKLA